MNIVLDSLIYCQKEKGLVIYSWCIMSNHVHLVVSAKEENLSAVLRDFKNYTSAQILKAIENNHKESRRNWMLWIFKAAGNKNPNHTHYQFRRQDNQPKELKTNTFTQQKIDYIHNNPVNTGLVALPEHYRYSSAMDYAGGEGLIEVVLV